MLKQCFYTDLCRSPCCQDIINQHDPAPTQQTPVTGPQRDSSRHLPPPPLPGEPCERCSPEPPLQRIWITGKPFPSGKGHGHQGRLIISTLPQTPTMHRNRHKHHIRSYQVPPCPGHEMGQSCSMFCPASIFQSHDKAAGLSFIQKSRPCPVPWRWRPFTVCTKHPTLGHLLLRDGQGTGITEGRMDKPEPSKTAPTQKATTRCHFLPA